MTTSEDDAEGRSGREIAAEKEKLDNQTLKSCLATERDMQARVADAFQSYKWVIQLDAYALRVITFPAGSAAILLMHRPLVRIC